MAGGARDDEELISAINVTPLVDVVLVLLIILMVTATAIVSKNIPMELPKASTGEALPNSTLTVSIDDHAKIFVDEVPTTEEGLRAKVRSTKALDANMSVSIAADGRVAYAYVMRVMDLLRQERVTRFRMNVRPEDAQ